MKHPPVMDRRIDPDVLLRALDHAILRGSVANQLAEYDRAMWGLELEEVFGTGARVIAAMQLALAEQEVAIGALEARIFDLEQTAERRHQPYSSRSIGDMIVWTGREMGLRPADIRGESRIAALVMARQVIAFVAHEHFGHSYARIARALGGRDHTTIITAVGRARLRMGSADFADLANRLLAHFTVRES